MLTANRIATIFGLLSDIKFNTYKLYIFHNLQIGFRQVRDDFKKLFDAIVDGNCDGLVTKFFNFCVGDFVITFISISTFAFCDWTSFDIFLDQFSDLKIKGINTNNKPMLSDAIL